MDEQRLPDMGNRDGMKGTLNETMNQARDQARSAIRDAGEQMSSATAKAGTMAQDLMRQAREQAGPTADMLREQGTRATEYLTRNVNEYPLAALLMAGILGYGLAYLIHSRWS